MILGVFKLRLLCILGFTPNVMKCTSCKEDQEISYFSIKDNGLKCNICGKQDTSCIQINSSTVKAIKYTIIAPPKKLYSFNLKEDSLEEFKLVTKLYFDEKLEKEYKLTDLF